MALDVVPPVLRDTLLVLGIALIFGGLISISSVAVNAIFGTPRLARRWIGWS